MANSSRSIIGISFKPVGLVTFPNRQGPQEMGAVRGAHVAISCPRRRGAECVLESAHGMPSRQDTFWTWQITRRNEESRAHLMNQRLDVGDGLSTRARSGVIQWSRFRLQEKGHSAILLEAL